MMTCEENLLEAQQLIADFTNEAVEKGLITLIPGFAVATLIMAGGQRFPEVRATNTGFTNTGVSSHTVPLPASLVAGELLLIGVAVNSNNTETFSTPAGWTVLVNNQKNGATQGAQAWFWKIASGSEGASVTVTSSGAARGAYNSYAISHADTSQAPSALAVADAGASVNPNPPSLTPSWGSSKNLWLAAYSATHNATQTDLPDNYATSVEANASTATGAVMSSCRRGVEDTVQDPSTFTCASSRWVATTIAIKGAGGSVNPPRILDGYSNVTGAWSLSRAIVGSFGNSVRYTTDVGVNSLKDQTGNGWHFSQATAANQPSVQTGIGLNLRTGARFDGSNDQLANLGTALSLMSGTTGYAVVCCILRAVDTNDSDPHENDTAFCDQDSGVSVLGFNFKNNSGTYSWAAFNTVAGPIRHEAGATFASSPIGTVIVCEWRHESGTLYGRMTESGGTPGAWQSIASGTTGGFPGLIMLGGNSSFPTQIDLLEMVTFNAVPNDTLKDALVTNMLAHYG